MKHLFQILAVSSNAVVSGTFIPESLSTLTNNLWIFGLWICDLVNLCGLIGCLILHLSSYGQPDSSAGYGPVLVKLLAYIPSVHLNSKVRSEPLPIASWAKIWKLETCIFQSHIFSGLELARVPQVPGTRRNSEHHLWHPQILRFLILTKSSFYVISGTLSFQFLTQALLFR